MQYLNDEMIAASLMEAVDEAVHAPSSTGTTAHAAAIDSGGGTASFTDDSGAADWSLLSDRDSNACSLGEPPACARYIYG